MDNPIPKLCVLRNTFDSAVKVKVTCEFMCVTKRDLIVPEVEIAELMLDTAKLRFISINNSDPTMCGTNCKATPKSVLLTVFRVRKIVDKPSRENTANAPMFIPFLV